VQGGGHGVGLDLLQRLDQGCPHLIDVGAEVAAVLEGGTEGQ
jgi:hypothetical protein